jgi:hypothetical protein
MSHGMEPHPNRWTAADDATLVRRIGEGASASQIALELGRSRSAVCGRGFRKGLHFACNGTYQAIVRRSKPTDKAGRVWIKRFSAEEDKTILAMAADGKSGFDIGQVLNRHKSSIVKRARLLGAKLEGKDGPKPKPEPKSKWVKLHPGNIAGKKESRTHDPAFNHVTPVVAVEPLMVALVDLAPSHCRFPVGDPREEGFGFCGHPKVDVAYCGHHARLCYTAPEMRRRAAA